MKLGLWMLLLWVGVCPLAAQNVKTVHHPTKAILPGACRISEYIPLLKGKRVAIFANQTSVIGHTHVVDTLQKLGIAIRKIFSPEHGFRGKADAGEKVGNYTDAATGIPVVSLYGKKRAPNAEDLVDVDVLLFDVQDVGTRFYTYISSLEEYLKSAILYDKPLVVLDRPNPNGFYVDGPVLDSAYKSFVGMQCIPIVYGMTIGEYAKMLLGEQLLPWRYIRKQGNNLSLSEVLGFEEKRKNFALTVIRCINYTHQSKYVLPIAPSPNLPDMASIYWYPTTCLFEGTVLSEGRGTEHPFCIFGHPNYPNNLFRFVPASKEGAKEPKHKGDTCYGWNVYGSNEAVLHQINGQIQLQYLINAYQLFPAKDSFFLLSPIKKPTDYFFNKLAGSDELRQQLIAQKTAAEISASWQPQLAAFKKIRKKYLLYAE